MKHSNPTFYASLTEGENEFLRHVSMWGSDAYPLRKTGRHWAVDRLFNVGGSPSTYPTKKAAVGQVELFLSLLRDKAAGRMGPSLGSPAYDCSHEADETDCCKHCGMRI